jgi:hypothetical protein
MDLFGEAYPALRQWDSPHDKCPVNLGEPHYAAAAFSLADVNHGVRFVRCLPLLRADGVAMRTDETGWVPEDWDLDVATALRNELLLLDPRVRAKPDAVRELLHEDFVEYGSSGRTWNHCDAVVGLEKNPGDGALEAFNVRAARLGPDAVLLTYGVRVPGKGASLRSSVWRRDGERWRLFFHQCTPSRYLD